MLRIAKVKPLDGYLLRLTLTSGTVIERDFNHYARRASGVLRSLGDLKFFRKVRASHGTIEWPGQIDLCPTSIIWGGDPRPGRPRARASFRRGGLLRPMS